MWKTKPAAEPHPGHVHLEDMVQDVLVTRATMGLFGVCFSSTHLIHFPCGIWLRETKNYPLVRYETISFCQFEVKYMSLLIGQRTLAAAVSLEGESISVGAGRISPHLRVVHINTDWDKRCCAKRQYKDYSYSLPSSIESYIAVLLPVIPCLLVINSKITPVSFSLTVIRWLYFCHISQSTHARVYFGIMLFSRDRITNVISSDIKMEQ